MRILTFLVVVAFLGSADAVRADKEATPKLRTETVANGKFLFVMFCHTARETERSKAIRAEYPESGLYKNDGSKELLWTIDWYREQVAILDDGVHMVRYGNWPGRKVGSKGTPITKEELRKEAISFFAKGKVLREVTIGEVVDDATKLPKTVSHFRWMKESRVIDDKKQFEVITFDGNLIRFDITTGKIIAKRKAD